MACKHLVNGVPKRGKPSIEWLKNGKPQYYCYGFGKTETELCDECQECKQNVI